MPLSEAPASLQLRYLQTLLELGADQNSTVVFPLPMDIVGPLMGALNQLAPEESQSRRETSPAPDSTRTRSDTHGLAVVDDRAEGRSR